MLGNESSLFLRDYIQDHVDKQTGTSNKLTLLGEVLDIVTDIQMQVSEMGHAQGDGDTYREEDEEEVHNKVSEEDIEESDELLAGAGDTEEDES